MQHLVFIEHLVSVCFCHSATFNGAAVGVLICSENACNPVLRASIRAALQIYSRYGIAPNCSNDNIVSKHTMACKLETTPTQNLHLFSRINTTRVEEIRELLSADGSCEHALTSEQPSESPTSNYL